MNRPQGERVPHPTVGSNGCFWQGLDDLRIVVQGLKARSARGVPEKVFRTVRDFGIFLVDRLFDAFSILNGYLRTTGSYWMPHSPREKYSLGNQQGLTIVNPSEVPATFARIESHPQAGLTYKTEQKDDRLILSLANSILDSTATNTLSCLFIALFNTEQAILVICIPVA